MNELEELLLTYSSYEYTGDVEPGELPAPLAGRVALEAMQRLWEAIAPTQGDHVVKAGTTGRLLASDGRYEFVPLCLVEFEATDVDILAAAARVLGDPHARQAVRDGLEDGQPTCPPTNWSSAPPSWPGCWTWPTPTTPRCSASAWPPPASTAPTGRHRGQMLFLVAAMAAEMERDLIQERTLEGLAAARAVGRVGGRPVVVTEDVLAMARARRERGHSVTKIARELGIERSTLYRALEGDALHGANAITAAAVDQDHDDPGAARPPLPSKSRRLRNRPLATMRVRPALRPTLTGCATCGPLPGWARTGPPTTTTCCGGGARPAPAA
ncbi:helix-turn-helix domain-containing protein [Nonomuraea zeae]|uniref:Recombinase family protein n=1 Tax=Nonomuraea zeae TaxID=1642303 RepID=A0A5S4FRB2_9ACTN|nr:helix-turn-helix domain-containing protein [Nonomuraea zeae]TMR23267.1 recombinase family protein [Nonomuraea zeae]